jgi:hypothetical protein
MKCDGLGNVKCAQLPVVGGFERHRCHDCHHDHPLHLLPPVPEAGRVRWDLHLTNGRTRVMPDEQQAWRALDACKAGWVASVPTFRDFAVPFAFGLGVN